MPCPKLQKSNYYKHKYENVREKHSSFSDIHEKFVVENKDYGKMDSCNIQEFQRPNQKTFPYFFRFIYNEVINLNKVVISS